MSQSITDRIIKSLAKHPYLWTFLFCLVINPFYLGSSGNVPNNARMIEFFICASAVGIFVFHKYKTGSFVKKQAIILAVLLEALVCVGAVLYSKANDKGIWMFAGGCVLLLMFGWFAKTKQYRGQINALMLIGISFFVKFYYVFYTSVYTRQHDVGTFGEESRHAGYIEYILFNHKLPDFDVREIWQYCHPPLHHAICAGWIYINENIFGVGHDPARESLQTLTLFYSMCIVITAYKIFRHFKLKGAALIIPTMIVAFHPAFILFSGSINNDVLSVAFMMGAVYCTLKWYDNQTLKNILKIALCVGLGMMTKLSAALVAPPIAIVFLWVFIKKIKTDWKRLIGQFAAFGAVCVPLGLWFEVKNYILYKVPITYVQEISTTETQYLGNESYWTRISDFSPKQLSSVFENWLWYDNSGAAHSYNEHNPIIAILKNSVFGEFIDKNSFKDGSVLLTFCTVLFWLGVFIAAVALICMIVMMFRKCSMQPAHKVFFLSFYVSMMANIYKMAYDYPFTCTLNFRYITPTVIIGALFLGLAFKDMRSGKNKTMRDFSVTLTIMTFAFVFCSATVYIGVCLPSAQ